LGNDIARASRQSGSISLLRFPAVASLNSSDASNGEYGQVPICTWPKFRISEQGDLLCLHCEFARETIPPQGVGVTHPGFHPSQPHEPPSTSWAIPSDASPSRIGRRDDLRYPEPHNRGSDVRGAHACAFGFSFGRAVMGHKRDLEQKSRGARGLPQVDLSEDYGRRTGLTQAATPETGSRLGKLRELISLAPARLGASVTLGRSACFLRARTEQRSARRLLCHPMVRLSTWISSPCGATGD
jgi:hypothetical protein